MTNQDIFETRTELFNEIAQATTLTETTGSRYVGNCPFPNHPKRRAKSFYYFGSTDTFCCYACPSNTTTANGKDCFSGGLSLFREKMKEPIAEKDETLPRSNSNLRLEIKLLSGLLLTPLTEFQAKAVSLLLAEALGRRVSQAEIARTLAGLLNQKDPEHLN